MNRGRGRSGRPARAACLHLGRIAAGLAIALGTSGCAGLFGSYDFAPNGLSRDADTLRRLLVTTRYDSALVRVAPESDAAPEDELLRLLDRGIIARYAGKYEQSNEALSRATILAEDRYTKSIARSAFSLLANDLVLPYEPGRAERLLVHYYGALNYLALGDAEDAAVEARRMSYLLEQYEEQGMGPGPSCGLAGGPRACGVLRYFAGAIFRNAGQENDAEVAFRHARALGALPPVDSAAPGTGEVLVFLERGFVAHRVEQTLVVPLLPIEVDAMSGGDADERLAAAVLVAARVLEQVLRETGTVYPDGRGFRETIRIDPPSEKETRVPRRCTDRDRRERDDPEPDTTRRGPRGVVVGIPDVNAPNGSWPRGRRPPPRPCTAVSMGELDENPYLLKVAWPVFRTERRPPRAASIIGPDGRRAHVQLRADLSEAVIGDFEQERTLLLARTIARAATKFALTRTVENKIGGEDSTAGRILGLITNLTTALLERADTRSWHLLPSRIGVARLRLPAGRHPLTLQLGSDEAGRRVDLGLVDVRAGSVTIVSTRAWR